MNYPNDYIYKYVEEEISKQNLYDKKVLFVFGDSWTNNRYVKNPKKHWCYLFYTWSYSPFYGRYRNSFSSTKHDSFSSL